MAITGFILALFFAACQSTGSKQTNNTDSSSMQSTATSSASVSAKTKPADGILTGYINLKNSLAADNAKAAAKSGKEILDALSKFDVSALTPDQKRVFLSLAGDIKENSEHINEHADDIAHQREHFEMLSKDMYDVTKSIDTDKTLYLDSCPMYDAGKGTWLSEMKEIRNPYFGKKMETCGAIKETISN